MPAKHDQWKNIPPETRHSKDSIFAHVCLGIETDLIPFVEKVILVVTA